MNQHNDNIEFKLKFDVPDGYFDSLAGNVMANIKFEDQKRSRRISIFRRSLSVAAVLCLVSGLCVWSIPESNHDRQAELNYLDFVTDGIANSYSDYGVMEYLDFNELPYGSDVEDADAYDLVSEFYASPVNLYIYQ